jgi:sugar phosphate isomerase/epimerase
VVGGRLIGGGQGMRLGGPVFGDTDTPEGWVEALRADGYRAAFCPLRLMDDADAVRAYEKAALDADIVIAEVGAFGNNPISPDDAVRAEGVANCQAKLALADEIGARCCVNVSGSRGESWAGHHEDNLTPETFDLIVASVREIIDAVKPTRTVYALETMPWMYPDSADSYVELVKAIDREGCGIHFDPVNIVNSPQRYYENAAMIRDCFKKLGTAIVSCHAKDIVMSEKLTVHLDEIAPGQGNLDYTVFLAELDKLGPDIPIMLEHLKGAEAYAEAAAHVRSVGKDLGVTF